MTRALPIAVAQVDPLGAALMQFSTAMLLDLQFHPYSPELNPDELVWNVVKGKVSGRAVVDSKQTMRSLIRGALIKLQRSTEIVKRLFHEKHVSYILDEQICRV